MLCFREFDTDRPDLTFESVCDIMGCDEATKALKLHAKRIRLEHLLTKKVEVTFRGAVKEPYRGPLFAGFSMFRPDEDPFGWVCFDDGREVDITKPLFFLHLATVEYRVDPKTVHYGLVLERVPHDEERYRRVGLGSTWNIDWMGDAQKVDTSIV